MACQNDSLMSRIDWWAWRIFGGMILLLFLCYASVQEVRSIHRLRRVLVSEYALAAVRLTAFCADTEWLLATATDTDFRTQSDICLARAIASRQANR